MKIAVLILQIVYHIFKYWSDPDRMEAAVQRDMIDARIGRINATKEGIDENDEDKIHAAAAGLLRARLERKLRDARDDR